MNNIEICKRVVNNLQYEEVDDIILDVQTANAILKVYEVLSEKNKEHFINMSITRMSNVAWNILK